MRPASTTFVVIGVVLLILVAVGAIVYREVGLGDDGKGGPNFNG